MSLISCHWILVVEMFSLISQYLKKKFDFGNSSSRANSPLGPFSSCSGAFDHIVVCTCVWQCIFQLILWAFNSVVGSKTSFYWHTPPFILHEKIFFTGQRYKGNLKSATSGKTLIYWWRSCNIVASSNFFFLPPSSFHPIYFWTISFIKFNSQVHTCSPRPRFGLICFISIYTVQNHWMDPKHIHTLL